MFWYKARNEGGSTGVVPRPFLVPVEGEWLCAIHCVDSSSKCTVVFSSQVLWSIMASLTSMPGNANFLSYIPYSAKFSRNLYFVEWPLKAFRCTMFAE